MKLNDLIRKNGEEMNEVDKAIEYLKTPIKRKVCPNCGLCQCHSQVHCSKDGGLFTSLDVDNLWQIRTNIKSGGYSLYYWFAIHGFGYEHREIFITIKEFDEIIKENLLPLKESRNV